MQRIAIITTHPIQYNAPLFSLLSGREGFEIKVFYTWGTAVIEKKFDPGFGKTIDWDIPLLEGYNFEFVNNVSKNAGSNHFFGIDNPSLITKIEDWDPTAILVFGWCFRSHLNVMRHFKGKKLILFRGDSNLIDEKKGFTIKKIARKLFLTWVYRQVDIALFTGIHNKAYYKRYGLKESQLFFAPHAIDNDRFSKIDNQDVRKEIGIPESAVVFLFTGKFESKKNPKLLLDCFISLKVSNSHLVLVGNGVLEKSLKNIVEEQKLEIRDRIHFLPFQNQSKMPAIYKMADVLVLPSQGPGETWGLSVNEAMACGRAVLVSDKCGCAPDLITNGENGYIFGSGNGEELKEKMIFFINNKEYIHDMQYSSTEKIKKWTFMKIIESLESLFFDNKK